MTLKTPPGTEQVQNRLTAIAVVSIRTVSVMASCSVGGFSLKRTSGPHSFRNPHPDLPLPLGMVEAQ